MASAGPSTSSKFLGSVFGKIGMVVYVLVASGWCLLIGTLPLDVALVALPDWHYYPVMLIALALSAPGIAALFAVLRDQPELSSRVAKIRMRALGDGYVPPDWIAASYYLPSEGGAALFRPYFRAYRTVFRRSLLQGLTFALIIFAAIYDAQIFDQTRFGVVLVPALLICIVLLADALLVSLILVVEYPKATWRSLVKNGVLLSVRRIYMLVVTMLAIGGYLWAATQKPILVVLLATGLIAYVVWAAARWQADRMFVLMARESGDERLMDMYTSAGRDDGRASSMATTADYQQ